MFSRQRSLKYPVVNQPADQPVPTGFLLPAAFPVPLIEGKNGGRGIVFGDDYAHFILCGQAVPVITPAAGAKVSGTMGLTYVQSPKRCFKKWANIQKWYRKCSVIPRLGLMEQAAGKLNAVFGQKKIKGHFRTLSPLQ